MTKVFISYSCKNKTAATKITETLQRSELETWIDWEDIPPTADWMDQIHKGIESAYGFLFLLSPDSVASKVCGQEVDYAVKNGKQLIPIVVRDVNPNDFHPALAKVNWIYCRENDDLDTAINKTLSAIRTDLAWVEAHRRLQVRAVEWDKRRDRSLLLRGKDLHEAEEQLASVGDKDPKPTDLQRHFVLESRRSETRTRRIVSSISAAAAVVPAVVAVIAVIQSINATNQAQRSLARQLASQAEVAGTGYDEDVQQLRGLLATESLLRFPTAEGDQALKIRMFKSQYNTLILISISTVYGHANSRTGSSKYTASACMNLAASAPSLTL